MTVITETSHPSLTLPRVDGRAGLKVTVETSDRSGAVLRPSDGEDLDGIRDGSLTLPPCARFEFRSYVICDEKKPGVVIGGGWHLSP